MHSPPKVCAHRYWSGCRLQHPSGFCPCWARSPSPSTNVAVPPNRSGCWCDRCESGQQGGVERYRLIEVLGTGGMSVVWRGYDEVLGRAVAVKLLAPKLLADPQSRRRILGEARAAALLSHP